MNFDIYTLFEEMFDYLQYSILKHAKTKNLWSYNIINLRKKAQELNMYSIDDHPYGGGAGMVISPIIFDNIDINKYTHRFYMSPRGEVWNQKIVKEISQYKNANILILCGRYEGVDQRILDYYDFKEISIGDYILCGGELPAMTIIESLVRCIPNVIKLESANNESFNNILLEHDLYTKPAIWRDMQVPKVLQEGNHKLIEKWKFINSLENTYIKRHDLYIEFIVIVIIIKLLLN